jgi:hypothetical protein
MRFPIFAVVLRSLLKSVDIHFVHMKALTRQRIDRNALGV